MSRSMVHPRASILYGTLVALFAAPGSARAQTTHAAPPPTPTAGMHAGPGGGSALVLVGGVLLTIGYAPPLVAVAFDFVSGHGDSNELLLLVPVFGPLVYALSPAW